MACQHYTLNEFNFAYIYATLSNNVTQWLTAMLISFKHISPFCFSICAMKNKYLDMIYLSLYLWYTLKVTIVVFADVFKYYFFISVVIIDRFQTSFKTSDLDFLNNLNEKSNKKLYKWLIIPPWTSERSSGGYIGIFLSVRLYVRLSVQIRVRPISFLWFDIGLRYLAHGSITIKRCVAYIHDPDSMFTYDLKVKFKGFCHVSMYDL